MMQKETIDDLTLIAGRPLRTDDEVDRVLVALPELLAAARREAVLREALNTATPFVVVSGTKDVIDIINKALAATGEVE